MSKKKKSTTKELLESGTRFTLKGYDTYVFQVKVDKSTTFLRKYHNEIDLLADTARVRRLGDKNLDYYTFDIFGKKTRGRVQYDSIVEFVTEVKAPAKKKKKKVVIEKCPVPGVDAIGVTLNLKK
tara:strand:- start:128 stop:502 length:375 start_codon:yes stop_codon:yes gene_type:complete